MAIPKAVACTLDMLFYLGCLVWPQWERKCLAVQRLEVPEFGEVNPGVSHPLIGEQDEVMGEGLWEEVTWKGVVSGMDVKCIS